MLEVTRAYEIPNRKYHSLIRELRGRGFEVRVHDRDGRWPDEVFASDGRVAGYIESPFMIRVEGAETPGYPGEELAGFLSWYNPLKKRSPRNI